jgi:hypothetical protein
LEAEKMKTISSTVVLALILCCLVVFPKTANTQGVATGGPANPANFCALQVQGAKVYVGGVYRHRDETIYYRCSRVLGRDAQPAGVAWIAGETRNSGFFLATTPTIGGQCTRPGNLRYSVGAAVVFGGSTYRCSDILGPDLKPTGVAWVEVEVRDNDSFLVK